MSNKDAFTSWKVKKDTASELIKIKGELQAVRGQTVNQDEAARELIECWKNHHTTKGRVLFE